MTKLSVRETTPGTWLVSNRFEPQDIAVWLYRTGFRCDRGHVSCPEIQAVMTDPDVSHCRAGDGCGEVAMGTVRAREPLPYCPAHHPQMSHKP